MTKKLIVGLGNPGEDYEGTRHNVGKEVVREIAQKENLKWQDQGYGMRTDWREAVLFIPKIFMNNSGLALAKLWDKGEFSTKEMVVVRDDLDMELGKVRGPVWKSGAGGHNGVISVLSEINADDFGQIKVGIGRPSDKNEISDFVTDKFSESEAEKISTAIATVIERLEEWTERAEDERND